MQHQHRGPPMPEPGFHPEPTPRAPSRDQFNQGYQYDGFRSASTTLPSPQANQHTTFSVVNPGFNLLKPIEWHKLRNRETFEPLTKFQIQTLTKGERKRYHGYLMDWQKWKNRTTQVMVGSNGDPHKGTSFNYSRMMDPE